MRQCENIFVFIDLTKSIGSDLGGAAPPPGPPQTPPMVSTQKKAPVISVMLSMYD